MKHADQYQTGGADAQLRGRFPCRSSESALGWASLAASEHTVDLDHGALLIPSAETAAETTWVCAAALCDRSKVDS